MARKQAKRRKQKTPPRIQMPKIRIGRILAPLFAIGIVFCDLRAEPANARS